MTYLVGIVSIGPHFKAVTKNKNEKIKTRERGISISSIIILNSLFWKPQNHKTSSLYMQILAENRHNISSFICIDAVAILFLLKWLHF